MPRPPTISPDLFRLTLPDERREIRDAALWRLVLQAADQPSAPSLPPDEVWKLLRTAPGRSQSDASFERLMLELLARTGPLPVGWEDWRALIGGIGSMWIPTDLTHSALLLRLTPSELQTSQEVRPAFPLARADMIRSRMKGTRPPALPRVPMRTPVPLTSGLMHDLLALADCKPWHTSIAVAEVSYTPAGRKRSLNLTGRTAVGRMRAGRLRARSAGAPVAYGNGTRGLS